MAVEWEENLQTESRRWDGRQWKISQSINFIQMLVGKFNDYCHPVECWQQDCRENDEKTWTCVFYLSLTPPSSLDSIHCVSLSFIDWKKQAFNTKWMEKEKDILSMDISISIHVYCFVIRLQFRGVLHVIFILSFSVAPLYTCERILCSTQKFNKTQK